LTWSPAQSHFVFEEFPDLKEDDIRACLAFAADRERKLELIGE